MAQVRRLRPPITTRLADEAAERARRNHEERLVELQQLPCVGLTPLGEISLVDGVATPIAHGLGRKPLMVFVSPVRGASSSGRVEEVRGAPHDRTRVVVLKATGFGATVTADVGVF